LEDEKMVKNVFLFLAIFLLSLNYSVAQQKTYSVTQQKEAVVDIQDAASFSVQSAKLNNVIAKNDGKFEEKFQLSFFLPNSFETSLNRAKVMLTAYKADGSVLGKHIWCSAALGKVEKISADALQVTLDANPKLEGANKYSLALIQGGDLLAPPDGGTTCQQCVALANDTCGRGGVGSVTCGADGGCSFTCR
jgi:hypothetical protein